MGRKNPDTRNKKACGLQIPYWQTSRAVYQALEGLALTKHGQQFAAKFTEVLCRWLFQPHHLKWLLLGGKKTTKGTDSSSKWVKPSFRKVSSYINHYFCFIKGMSLKT